MVLIDKSYELKVHLIYIFNNKNILFQETFILLNCYVVNMLDCVSLKISWFSIRLYKYQIYISIHKWEIKLHIICVIIGSYLQTNKTILRILTIIFLTKTQIKTISYYISIFVYYMTVLKMDNTYKNYM